MKKLFLCMIAVLGFASMSFADNYVVDQNAIDRAFSAAVEVNLADINLSGIDAFNMNVNAQMPNLTADVNPWAAFAICWVVGGFGVHRHYLGTSRPMWLYYTLTCGGVFGVAAVVDWVVLLVGAIKDDISAYIGNDQFFMWL